MKYYGERNQRYWGLYNKLCQLKVAPNPIKREWAFISNLFYRIRISIQKAEIDYCKGFYENNEEIQSKFLINDGGRKRVAHPSKEEWALKVAKIRAIRSFL